MSPSKTATKELTARTRETYANARKAIADTTAELERRLERMREALDRGTRGAAAPIDLHAARGRR